MNEFDIDVIIPTRGTNLTQLTACIDALRAQTYKVNIIIVHSRINLALHTRLHKAFDSDCTVVEEPQTRVKGSKRAVACNYGLKYCSRKFVGFIDDDVIVPQTWSQAYLKYFELAGDTPSDIITPAGLTSGCKASTSPYHLVQHFGSDSHAREFTNISMVQSIPGYNSMYLRSAVIDVGCFSENIGGCEDWELNYRLRKARYLLIGVPEEPVLHRHSYSAWSFAKQMFGYGWSRARLLKVKHIFTPLHALPSVGLIALIGLRADLLIAAIGLYALGITVLTLKTKTHKFVQTFLAFPIMHVTWAIGYLKGLIR